MYVLTIPVYLHFLGTADLLLEKAEKFCAEQGLDATSLLECRLAEDMFPFARQIQLTTDFATRAADRLSGREIRAFPDTETSLAELRARVAAAREYLKSFAPSEFEDAKTREITIQTRQGPIMMNGEQFLETYSKPQFFFHLTTAYDLLRQKGLPLGKTDFMNVGRR